MPTTLLGDGNTMKEDTTPTLRKFKAQWRRQADKQMITVGWSLYISLPELLLAVPSHSTLRAPLGSP